VLGINLLLIICKWIAYFLSGKVAIIQSLFDSFGDVLGNVAVIAFRGEVGVLITAVLMGLASVGVIIPAATQLLALMGWLAIDKNQGTVDGSDSDKFTAVVLILVAVVTKGLIYMRCRILTCKEHGEACIAVQAIKEDAANDVVMNSGALLCAFPDMWLSLLGAWLPEALGRSLAPAMDPAWAFLMSLPILHGWCTTAREQISVLRKEFQMGRHKAE